MTSTATTGSLAKTIYPDEQEMIGFALREAAKLCPDMLIREGLDDIARFVRFAQRRKAARRKKGLAASWTIWSMV